MYMEGDTYFERDTMEEEDFGMGWEEQHQKPEEHHVIEDKQAPFNTRRTFARTSKHCANETIAIAGKDEQTGLYKDDELTGKEHFDKRGNPGRGLSREQKHHGNVAEPLTSDTGTTAPKHEEFNTPPHTSSRKRARSSMGNSGRNRTPKRRQRKRLTDEELQEIAAGIGPEAKKAARQLRNRASAAYSRQKKEQEVLDLRRRSQELQKQIRERDTQLAEKERIIRELSERLRQHNGNSVRVDVSGWQRTTKNGKALQTYNVQQDDDSDKKENQVKWCRMSGISSENPAAVPVVPC